MKTKLSIAGKTSIMIGCLSFIPIQNISAQSADIFQSLGDSPQTKASGDLTKSNPDIELIKSKPSRHVIGNVELYTKARMANFSMQSRTMDIFGLYQDPKLKPAINNNPTPIVKTPTNYAPKALAEIIKGIKVSTVMVKGKSFLVGDRVIKESEELPISYDQGKIKRVKVVKVEAKQIIFKDIDGGGEAILKLEVLPFGMEAGDSRIVPDGMVTPTKNSPLIIGNE
jgi:hypothetical protein